MIGCGCCIELETPKSILEEQELDVFAEITDESGLTYKSVMKQALWHYYRIRCIGSCDVDEWMQAMKDRLALVGPKWDAVLDRASQTDLTDLYDRKYEREIKHTAIDGTEGDVSTDSTEGSNTSVTENEDLPQTVTGSAKYLSARVTVTDTPGVTRTSKYKPNTKDTESYAEDKDLPAREFDKMMTAYPTVLYNFAREFEPYFIQVLPC